MIHKLNIFGAKRALSVRNAPTTAGGAGTESLAASSSCVVNKVSTLPVLAFYAAEKNIKSEVENCMSVRNSLWTLLVQDEVDTSEEVVASIRLAMTAAIDELVSPDVRDLDGKVSNASNISELWNLLPEMRHAMEAEQSEEVARNRLNKITGMFRKY